MRITNYIWGKKHIINTYNNCCKKRREYIPNTISVYNKDNNVNVYTQVQYIFSLYSWLTDTVLVHILLNNNPFPHYTALQRTRQLVGTENIPTNIIDEHFNSLQINAAPLCLNPKPLIYNISDVIPSAYIKTLWRHPLHQSPKQTGVVVLCYSLNLC